MRAARAVACGCALLAAAGTARAQGAGGADPADPDVQGTVSNLTRVETWRFFQPAIEGVDPGYTFVGNRSDLALRVGGRRLDLGGAFAYVRAEGLPRRAIGPGGLGTGAFYFVSSGLPYSYQVFLTELTVRIHREDGRLALMLGRMPYTSGAEGEHPAEGTSPLARVRRLATDGRLVGTFDWSLYRRRFDGVKADWRGNRRYAGTGAFLVTQGGYEESANLTMPRLFVGSAYAGQRHGRPGTGRDAETQVFAVLYRDRRAIDIRPDNAAVPASSVDVSVAAAGASHAGVRERGGGTLDWAGWGAYQLGGWYGQPHRAYAVAAQAGYRRHASAWSPWVRAGASLASGDRDGRDGRHETFFAMLQETRTYAQSMVYAQMNLRDLFLQVHAEPHGRARLRVDLHRLDLARASDRWYQGSGATARDGRFFGFSSRSSSGARRLGTVVEASGDLRLSRAWSVNGYVAHMRGGPVVRGLFASNRLTFWYVENVIAVVLKS